MKCITLKCAALISYAFFAMSLMIAGCKTNEQIQVVQPQIVVTNSTSTGAFNDEHYVWEGFIFSTNQVKEVKK